MPKVSCSGEVSPLLKDSTKWHGRSPITWIEWPWPFGKYHRSPGPKLLISLAPSGPSATVWQRPAMTNAHSDAMACQCSSREAPGSRNMCTPDIAREIGNCSAVTSFV